MPGSGSFKISDKVEFNKTSFNKGKFRVTLLNLETHCITMVSDDMTE